MYPRQRSFSKRTVLDIVFAIEVILTNYVVSVWAVFWVHWSYSWKPNLAGYWLIPKQTPEKQASYMFLLMLRKSQAVVGIEHHTLAWPHMLYHWATQPLLHINNSPYFNVIPYLPSRVSQSIIGYFVYLSRHCQLSWLSALQLSAIQPRGRGLRTSPQCFCLHSLLFK